MEVISGEKIVKSYGKFKVLKGINLNVQDGEFVGIMGKSVYRFHIFLSCHWKD